MRIIETLKGQHLFKDKSGHTVLWQSPNIPLYGWALSKIIALIIGHGHIKSGFEQVSMAFIFAWALLEITHGVNYFRRLLGLLIFIATIISYFK